MATSWNHYGHAFNAAGQRLNLNQNQRQAAYEATTIQIGVTLNDRTVSGVKASQIDTGSNSPQAY